MIARWEISFTQFVKSSSVVSTFKSLNIKDPIPKLFKVHIATQAIRSFEMVILVSRKQWLEQAIGNHLFFFFFPFPKLLLCRLLSHLASDSSKRGCWLPFQNPLICHWSKGLEVSCLFHAKQGPNNRNRKPFLSPQPLPRLASQWFIQGNTRKKKKNHPHTFTNTLTSTRIETKMFVLFK